MDDAPALSVPRPAAVTCGACGEVYGDWAWDGEDGQWEADFEWWHHPPSGHDFLCCRQCWLKVHREHCGSGVRCMRGGDLIP